MGKRGRRSDVEVERLQITLAKPELGLLNHVIKLGGFGRNPNDVAAAIINDWLKTRFADEIKAHLKLKQRLEELNKLPSKEEEVAT